VGFDFIKNEYFVAALIELTSSYEVKPIRQEINMAAIYKTAKPYADDALNLPVRDVDAAIPFYETIMGFTVVSRSDTPHKSAILGRDDIQIGLVENGGDPEQEGCFFEVDDAEAAFAELKANAIGREEANYDIQHYGGTAFKVFFVVAPDGLCYCLGERQG